MGRSPLSLQIQNYQRTFHNLKRVFNKFRADSKKHAPVCKADFPYVLQSAERIIARLNPLDTDDPLNSGDAVALFNPHRTTDAAEFLG